MYTENQKKCDKIIRKLKDIKDRVFIAEYLKDIERQLLEYKRQDCNLCDKVIECDLGTECPNEK